MFFCDTIKWQGGRLKGQNFFINNTKEKDHEPGNEHEPIFFRVALSR